VPVTVQVWDCLGSPMGTTLGPNMVPVMDPWERPVLVSQVIVSRRAKELCSSGAFVVLVEAVDVGYPFAECKSVEFHPCDSRVWECLPPCVAPCLK
jgi:hypothetical protein